MTSTRRCSIVRCAVSIRRAPPSNRSSRSPGLAYHVVDPDQTRFCAGQFHLPGSAHLYREGKGGHHGWMNLTEAIAKSCDVYFYGLADQIGVDHIATFMSPFGFGRSTGIDISGELHGLLPDRAWKAAHFARPADKMWFPGETVNFGIGQGYLNVTPLQMAHYVSVLASRGKVFKPRLVTGFRDALNGADQAARARFANLTSRSPLPSNGTGSTPA